MMDHELDQLPNFLRLLISSCCGFSQKSSKYNNLVAMAATAVCNYTNTNGFTQCGHGPQSVFMNGRVHHYMRIASTTLQNCASEVVLCPILYCIDVFSTYLGKILDFVVVHWSFIFVSHVSRLIVEFI